MAKGLSNEDMSQFSDIVEIQGQSKSVTEKKISDGEEMTENINDRSETEFTLVEDPLNMHRTALNVTTLVSEIPNTINQENGITAPGQGKNPVLILRDNFVKSKHFLVLFLRVKLKLAIMLLEIFQKKSCSVLK